MLPAAPAVLVGGCLAMVAPAVLAERPSWVPVEPVAPGVPADSSSARAVLVVPAVLAERE
ncbi:hypothetical protein MBOU_42130 [Mycobacterium bourgelatii]|uniref:Uncharacterized protein n=1 Tax=Mycobacterium bourgelatii TaxID=1273442 RepID=A0A7I9YU09_MYCBU|nr:hypothetical protein MBOU_42130 [Mycobacterium bourgelatii]